MTQTPSPTLRVAAPLLLATAAALAAAEWYFDPAKASNVVVALATMTGIALVLWLLPRSMERAAAASGWNTSRRNGVDSIRGAVVFASLILIAGLGPDVAVGLGLVDPGIGGEFGRRGAMVLTGLFLMLTGNAMPKTLTPLSSACCGGDAAKTQAFQRFFGWTWVLMGLGFTIVWLTLPVEIARPVSMTLVVLAILLVATAMIRMVRANRRDRTNSPARP